MILEPLKKLIGIKSKTSPKPVSFDWVYRTFLKRLEKWPQAMGGPKQGRAVSVLITPWMQTAVPFFSLEVALMLSRAGRPVKVIWDDTDLVGNSGKNREVDAINDVLSRLPKELEVIAVSQLSATETRESDGPLAKRIRFDNGIMRRRGETTVDEFYAAHPESGERILRHLGIVRALLRGLNIEWMLVPGGIYGVSSAYIAMAQELGIGLSGYDCGYGMLILAQGGLAGHQHDVDDCYRRFTEQAAANPKSRQLAEESATRELQQRMIGKGNYFDFQIAGVEGREKRTFDVLVPLNLRWDAAALGRQNVFASVSEWLTYLIEWANARPDVRLCVRQHPVERHAPWRSTDDVRGLVERLNKAPDRIVFIAADDPVNTYELLRPAKVVLPYTSSVGVESAMLGKAVILATHCYYQGFPFSQKAATREQYLDLIDQALTGKFDGIDETKAVAAQVYHLTQNCNLMRTKFTAEPRDCPQWLEVPPEELWAWPELQDLKSALLTRAPLSFLRHSRFVAESSNPPA